MVPTTPEFDLSCQLSDDAIEALNHEALADVIRRADLPHLSADVAQRLPLYDRPTLMRLAFLARHCSRNRAVTAE